MISIPDLAQAQVLSKLDLSSAFWQIKLDEESCWLSTFNTPYGRFRRLRLSFGSVLSEIFQRLIHMALEGLPCVADDLLLYGKGADKQEALANHDSNLKALLL